MDPLIAGAGRSDPVSWRVLFDRHYRNLLVYATLRSRSPERARLAVREAVVRAIESVRPGELEDEGVAVVLLRSLSAVLRAGDDPFAGLSLSDPPRVTKASLRAAFDELPGDQREVISLLAATGSIEQAASILGRPPAVVGKLAVQGCRALDGPGQERAVVERLRAGAADPLALPDAEDGAIVWAAAARGRERRRARARTVAMGAAVAACAFVGTVAAGGPVGRGLLELAHGVGLPVASPRAGDVHTALGSLRSAVAAGDRRAAQAALVRVSAAYGALSADDRKDLGGDVDDAILDAQRFLAGQGGPPVLAAPPVAAPSTPASPASAPATGGTQPARAAAPTTRPSPPAAAVSSPETRSPEVAPGLSSADVESRLAADPTPAPRPAPSPSPSGSPSSGPSPTTPETPEATPVPPS